MLCEFTTTQLPDGRYAHHCETCGVSSVSNRPIHRRRCGKASGKPTTAEKLYRFTKALWRWVAAGCPTRTEDEVQSLAAICAACPAFQPATNGRTIDGTCGKCGCKLSSEKKLVNKLVWRTETCPKGRWT